MTTPNIDGLIDRLYDWHNTSAERNRLDMQKAADLLQSQAERIKGLEAEIRHKAPVIATWRDKHDTLRAQLTALTATEPVAWMSPGKERLEFSRKDTVYGSHTIALFTHPMPAQDVTELVEALERLLESTTGVDQVSTVNEARTALAKYKGTK